MADPGGATGCSCGAFNSLQDLQHFNDFFIEKEEECIIRTQALEEQLAKAQPGGNISKLRSAFVDLHGEA